MPAAPAGAFALAAMSGHYDARTAAEEAAESLLARGAGPCELVLVFASFHHRAAFTDAAAILRRALGAPTLLGTTAESVLCGPVEQEGRSGLAAIAMRLPGARVHPFKIQGHDARIGAGPDAPRRLRAGMRIGPSHRATILLADPFSFPTSSVLGALGPHGDLPPALVVGGLASGASQPGQNVLVVNDRFDAFGAVGVTIAGDVRVDAFVSQGARPVGTPMVVTKVDGNVVKELGGRPAMEAAQEMAESLPESDRALLSHGLLIGIAVDEYRERFGRGDFLVRAILAGDRGTGAIAVGESLRVGRTVQFHVRDRATADEDLRLALDAEQLDSTPLATLVFTCHARGSRLFGAPHHDAALAHRRLGRGALAGYCAAGEIGPVRGRPHLHGQSVVVATVRAAGAASPL